MKINFITNFEIEMQLPLDSNNRILVDEITSWSVKTTYVWVCQDDNPLSVTSAAAVWKITRYVATTVSTTVTTLQYYPSNSAWNCERWYNQIWDNRASLTYV